jgi:putative flippase GtrA
MKRFVIFAGVGGAATLLQFILLALLVEFQLLPGVAASGVSYALAAVFSYYANYYLTFASNSNHSDTLPKFVATVILGLCVSTALFAIFLWLINQYLIAQCLASGITLVLNFSIHKLWIYRNH